MVHSARLDFRASFLTMLILGSAVGVATLMISGCQQAPSADVIATVYECLGVPHDLELRDRLQRPFTLVPWGSPIRDIIA